MARFASKFHTLGMVAAVAGSMAGGCSPLPVSGDFRGVFRGDANVATTVQGSLEVKVPALPEPGPLRAEVVRASPGGPGLTRIAIIDVDGLILNQNFTGLLSAGDNPVSAFREKLQAAAGDPAVRAVVLRVNSPGGGVTASDILAEELRRFREATGKPVVACLMDLATGGAYYVAVGADRVIAHPTTITGGIAAIFNIFNLADAAATFNITSRPIKAGELGDMGSVMAETGVEETTKGRALLQTIANSYRDRFLARVVQRRPALTASDRATLADGRVVPASQALSLHLVDRLGYLDDALAEAEGLAGCPGSEVIQYQRPGAPSRSVYAIAPNSPIQGDLLPFSYPGLDRSKVPTFLYLWEPDPTILRQSGR